MPNKNYRKGYEKERKIVNEAREQGLLAFRSAGSHSPVDCVIVDHHELKIRLVQSKPDKFSELDKKRLYDKHGYLNGVYKVVFEVI